MFNDGGVPKGSFTLYHAVRRDTDRRLSYQWRPQRDLDACGQWKDWAFCELPGLFGTPPGHPD